MGNEIVSTNDFWEDEAKKCDSAEIIKYWHATELEGILSGVKEEINAGRQGEIDWNKVANDILQSLETYFARLAANNYDDLSLDCIQNIKDAAAIAYQLNDWIASELLSLPGYPVLSIPFTIQTGYRDPRTLNFVETADFWEATRTPRAIAFAAVNTDNPNEIIASVVIPDTALSEEHMRQQTRAATAVYREREQKATQDQKEATLSQPSQSQTAENANAVATTEAETRFWTPREDENLNERCRAGDIVDFYSSYLLEPILQLIAQNEEPDWNGIAQRILQNLKDFFNRLAENNYAGLSMNCIDNIVLATKLVLGDIHFKLRGTPLGIYRGYINPTTRVINPSLEIADTRPVAFGAFFTGPDRVLRRIGSVVAEQTALGEERLRELAQLNPDRYGTPTQLQVEQQVEQQPPTGNTTNVISYPPIPNLEQNQCYQLLGSTETELKKIFDFITEHNGELSEEQRNLFLQDLPADLVQRIYDNCAIETGSRGHLNDYIGDTIGVIGALSSALTTNKGLISERLKPIDRNSYGGTHSLRELFEMDAAERDPFWSTESQRCNVDVIPSFFGLHVLADLNRRIQARSQSRDPKWDNFMFFVLFDIEQFYNALTSYSNPSLDCIRNIRLSTSEIVNDVNQVLQRYNVPFVIERGFMNAEQPDQFESSDFRFGSLFDPRPIAFAAVDKYRHNVIESVVIRNSAISPDVLQQLRERFPDDFLTEEQLAPQRAQAVQEQFARQREQAAQLLGQVERGEVPVNVPAAERIQRQITGEELEREARRGNIWYLTTDKLQYPSDWIARPAPYSITEEEEKNLLDNVQCYDVISNEDLKIAQHLKEDVNDNIVLISPAGPNARFGTYILCFSRSELARLLTDLTAIFLACTGTGSDSKYPADASHRFIRLPISYGNEINIFVPEEDVVPIANGTNRARLYQATRTDLTLQATASAESASGGNPMSGFHCQGGTETRIYHLLPLVTPTAALAAATPSVVAYQPLSPPTATQSEQARVLEAEQAARRVRRGQAAAEQALDRGQYLPQARQSRTFVGRGYAQNTPASNGYPRVPGSGRTAQQVQASAQLAELATQTPQQVASTLQNRASIAFPQSIPHSIAYAANPFQSQFMQPPSMAYAANPFQSQFMQ